MTAPENHGTARKRSSQFTIGDNAGRTIVLNGRDLTSSYNHDPVYSLKPSVHVEGAALYFLFPLVWIINTLTDIIVQWRNERVKGTFVDNTIRTALFTIYDFIPKQLLLQFSKVGNFYFLCISGLQQIPNVSPTGQYTTILPLAAFVGFGIAREGYEDYKRHLNDAAENNTKTKRLVKGASQVDWQEVAWMELKVGDIVKLEEGDFVAADILLIGSSLPRGICYIETSNLDGESDLKLKQSLPLTSNLLENDGRLLEFQATIHAASPNNSIYTFEGSIEIPNEGKNALSMTQLLPRGTTVANTPFLFGVVVYTGEETKIRKNATNSAVSKRSSLERLTNKVILCVMAGVVLMATVSTILSYSWSSYHGINSGTSSKLWYLDHAKFNVPLVFFSFVILYNNMIPISLYVAMEIVRLALALMINSDLRMYDEARDTPAQARTTNLLEELGQVQYLFTDKTGTLTENIMVFKKMSVAGMSYTHVSQSQSTDEEEDFSSAETGTELLRQEIIAGNAPDQSKSLLIAMALCHTVTVERRNGTMSRLNQSLHSVSQQSLSRQNISGHWSIVYQSASPDELALVNGAKEIGVVMRARTLTSISLSIFNSEDTVYEVKNILPFTSQRRRMSIIVRCPDSGDIRLICKGADTVIMERLSPSTILHEDEQDILEQTTTHVSNFATEGLRTLLYASKSIDPVYYKDWSTRYDEASVALENRQDKLDDLAAEIEQDLSLLGATAIEDKLQQGVPDTIESLKRAGIKVWMMTGDKKETAINIGYTCQLARLDSDMIMIEGSTVEALEHRISQATARCVTKRANLPYKEDDAEAEANTDLTNAVKGQIQKRNRRSTAQSVISKSSPKEYHCVAVIDGIAIGKLQEQHDQYLKTVELLMQQKRGSKTELRPVARSNQTSVLEQFIKFGMLCDGVICSRFSPSQKAVIISTLREMIRKHGNLDHSRPLQKPRVDLMNIIRTINISIQKFMLPQKIRSNVTLAIGDGANDIPMIECAHVGVGIAGREGLAASRAADFSISQFRCLKDLIFVHGRLSYLRICKFTKATFYKGVVLHVTQLLFQIVNGWSATSLYEQWTLALYNVVFTSLPVLIVGIFEKDLNQATLLGVPELYRFGTYNRGLNLKLFGKLMFEAVWHAFAAVIFCAIYYGVFLVDTDDNRFEGTRDSTFINFRTHVFMEGTGRNQENSLIIMGTIIFGITAFIANIKVQFQKTHNWTIFSCAAFCASEILWIIFMIIYPRMWPKINVGSDIAGANGALMSVFGLILCISVLSVVSALFCLDLWLDAHIEDFELVQQLREKEKNNDTPLTRVITTVTRSTTTGSSPSGIEMSMDFRKQLALARRFTRTLKRELDPDTCESIYTNVPWWQYWEHVNNFRPDTVAVVDDSTRWLHRSTETWLSRVSRSLRISRASKTGSMKENETKDAMKEPLERTGSDSKRHGLELLPKKSIASSTYPDQDDSGPPKPVSRHLSTTQNPNSRPTSVVSNNPNGNLKHRPSKHEDSRAPSVVFTDEVQIILEGPQQSRTVSVRRQSSLKAARDIVERQRSVDVKPTRRPSETSSQHPKLAFSKSGEATAGFINSDTVGVPPRLHPRVSETRKSAMRPMSASFEYEKGIMVGFDHANTSAVRLSASRVGLEAGQNSSTARLSTGKIENNSSARLSFGKTESNSARASTSRVAENDEKEEN